MASRSTHSDILIVGAGTWGCAIAWELAKRGFSSIKVLDGNNFPSAISAGNDLNKIAEEANEPVEDDSDVDYFWNTIHQIAMRAWKHDAILKPFYHATGFIMAAVGDDAFEHCREYARSERAELQILKTKEDFWKTMPEGILHGAFPGWRGFWKDGGAGWVSAREALKAMHKDAVKLGVQFVTGSPQGRVEGLLLSPASNAIRGARTADGIEHTADQMILAAGANSDSLLDFKKQLRPTAWTLAHLPMTSQEAEKYRDLPILYGVDRGFFFEPDHGNLEMKICDEHPGYINPVQVDGELRSVPFARQQIPKEAETRMRRLLSETTPQLASRPFAFARICWDADTVDRLFLIDKHPELRNLTVAVGGSGHGFMTCPAVGVLVAEVLKGGGELEDRVRKMMRWRPEISVGRDLWATQDRFGAEGKVMDFHDVQEWTEIKAGTKL